MSIQVTGQQAFDLYPDSSYTIGTTVSCLKYNNSAQCSECPAGFFLNEFLQCEQCMSGCASCNGRGTCSTCSNGYNWIPNKVVTATAGLSITGAGACSPCDNPYTLTCSTDGKTSLTCMDGSYLNSGKCLVCTAPCVTCQNAATTCTTCSYG